MWAHRPGGYHADKFTDMETAMQDRDLIWTTGTDLQIATLSARLRDLLFADGVLPSRLHVGELWSEEDPFGMMVVAHRWVLDGESMAFDTKRAGMHLRIELEPLYDLSGAVVGVAGRATPGVGTAPQSWDLQTLQEAERACGFGMWKTDLRSRGTLWSSGAYDILGVPPGGAIGDLRDYDHAEDVEIIASAIREGEITGAGYQCDHRIVRLDGTTRYVQEQLRVVYDEHGTACVHIGSLIDITERKTTEARLARMAHYDPVSKLPNRTLLEQRLHAALAKAQTNGSGCAVLFLDIDNFKRVNDTHGHATGDELLQAIGTRLTHHVRASDTVARISGDEFVIVLDSMRTPGDIELSARKILESFESPFQLSGSIECRVGASIGVAIYPGCGTSARSLIAAADREMYAVKRNGGRGVKIACASSFEDLSQLRTAVSG